MARENFVYIAKLAEQAERYDGECFVLPLSRSTVLVQLGLGFQILTGFHFFCEKIGRNGGCDEERGKAGCGVDCGRAEFTLGWIQERDRSAKSFLEDSIIDRAEGGVERERAEREADQGVQAKGGN